MFPLIIIEEIAGKLKCVGVINLAYPTEPNLNPAPAPAPSRFRQCDVTSLIVIISNNCRQSSATLSLF